jgi:ATP-dependent Zn proteases
MAVHETGHAVLAKLLGLPTQLTIALKSGYGGGTTVHINDSMPLRKFDELLLITKFGGTAADGLFGYESFDEGDRSLASQIAFKIVAEDFEGADTYRFGNSSCGDSNFSPLSNDLRVEIEGKVFELLKSAEEKARNIIESYEREGIDLIAKELVKRGFLVQRELDDLMEHGKKR